MFWGCSRNFINKHIHNSFKIICGIEGSKMNKNKFKLFQLPGRIIGTFVITACMFLVSCEPGEKVGITLNLLEGHNYGMRIEMDQEVTTSLIGQTKQTQSIAMDMNCLIERVDESGNMHMDMSYNTVKLNINSPMGSVNYDSSTHTGYVPELAKGYAALIGKHIKATISPAGIVSNIEGYESIYNAIMDSISFPEGPQKEQFVDQFKQQFGAESMREMMEQSMGYIPPHEVAVGESWSEEITIRSGFPMSMRNTYRLKEIREEMLRIAIDSKVTSNPDSKIQMGPMEISYSLTGTQNGSFYIDRKNGWVISSELKQDFSGDSIVTGQGVPGGTMTMPIKMISTIRYTTFDVGG